METKTAPRNIASLQVGETGIVCSVGMSNEILKHRLIDMGITVGTHIKLIKRAPMGDPLEIELRGYSLSIRSEDAQGICIVEHDDEAAFDEWHTAGRAKLQAEAKKQLAEYESIDTSDTDTREHAMRLTSFAVTDNKTCRDCNFDSCRERVNIEHDDNEKIDLHFALAGNPNCGKTTLFNALTGSKESVGNWPGVTVEKKEGRISVACEKGADNENAFCTHGHTMNLVDLPGIYSLSPHSMEEIVARNYLLNEKPDAIINIIDATNLERNLYLTVQLTELGIPMIIALNMMDEVNRQGDSIDCAALSSALGIPIVPISARTGSGVSSLVSSAQALLNVAHIQQHYNGYLEPDNLYDDFTHLIHHKIGNYIKPYAIKAGLPLHFAEIKLIERDELILSALALPDEIVQKVDDIILEYSGKNGYDDTEILIADSRYDFIESAVANAYHHGDKQKSIEFSRKIDKILTNKYLAIPIFLAVILLVFTLTFSTVGAFLSDAVGSLIGDTLYPAVLNALTNISVAPWLVSLVCDGIISGVGGVLTFLPQIAILFFLLSVLEDSGYMARIAFFMDKPMRRLGLSGKAIIPLLMGFGCTVPAAMGARTMSDISDKRMTIMLLPFMSCSAKLPVYALIAGAFFAKGKLLVILCLYAAAVLSGLLSAIVFKSTVFKKNNAGFLIELPPYRVPSAKTTLTHVWERVEHFLVKAGTLIFAMSVVLWFLMNFDFSLHMVTEQHFSILGIIGGFIAPVFTPCGFPFWQAVVALIVGIVAKEAVVSALAMFYGFSATAGSVAVHSALTVSGGFTTASALSFLVFVLLYTPCIAALTTMRSELASRKFMLISVGYQLLFAYIASTIVFCVCNLLA